jgi:tol-pal system protein YbgF
VISDCEETIVKTSGRIVALCILICAAAGTAYPQSREERAIFQLQTDVIGLKQQMTQLQNSLDEKNAVIRTLVERISDQVNSMSAGMQKIDQVVQSQNDKTAGEVRSLVTDVSRSISDLSRDMEAIRSQLGSLSQQITAMKASAEPLDGPEDVMRNATLDMVAGNYDLAVGGYQEFLAKFPNDSRAPEAQLGIGDAYYNQKKFEAAVIEYDLFLQNYPESDRTKSALYKKGLALAEYNPAQAITTLQKVVKDYPNTVEATNANQKVRDLNARRGR